jgi:prepilin-type N-terminal cleavage/methylation domain-containing protein
MMSNRQGFSLAELLVGLVVASIVSASIMQLMVVQSRFMSTQEGRSNARSVARAATGIIESDLRMVQTSAGVVSAAADAVTLRVPFAVGIVCGDQAGSTVVMFPPVDQVSWDAGVANIAGYGWRNGSNALQWYEGSVSPWSVTVGGAAPAQCAGLTPFPPATATRYVRMNQIAASYSGAVVFLHQRITYSFGNSVAVPGTRALWRTRVRENVPEELVAPFDARARFRFFSASAMDATDAPPADLNNLQGIELVLMGLNERSSSATDAETAPLRTAVFFKN